MNSPPIGAKSRLYYMHLIAGAATAGLGHDIISSTNAAGGSPPAVLNAKTTADLR